jgi:hypothetical protein
MRMCAWCGSLLVVTPVIFFICEQETLQALNIAWQSWSSRNTQNNN